MTGYEIQIFFSEEDRGYVASIPELEACSAFGDSTEEALLEVARAREAWIEAAKEAGKPIPRSKSRSADGRVHWIDGSPRSSLP